MKLEAEIKNFEDVCELVGGSQPSKDNFIFEPKDGYVRLIQVRDYRTDKFITFIPKEQARRFCNKEDIMIGRYGPPIFGIFRGLEGAYNVALMKAVVNEKICDKEYFYWFLKTDSLIRFVEHSSKRAAGQDGIRKELLDKYPIILPSLPEQKRIVAILDEAFYAISMAKSNAEQNLKNAKELFESYLQGVFENKGEGWEVQKFEDCFRLKSGDGLTSKNMSNDGEYLVFGGNGVAGLHNKYNLTGSNIVIGRVGALCGNVRHLTESVWLTDNAFKVVDFKFDFDHSFLTFLLNYKNLRGFARQAAQPVISNSSLKDVVLEFPTSLKTQQIIVKKLNCLEDEIKKLEVIYQQKIKNLEELKKSVLQKAFSGELKA
jgi:type I restriction enzyme S subunit